MLQEEHQGVGRGAVQGEEEGPGGRGGGAQVRQVLGQLEGRWGTGLEGGVHQDVGGRAGVRPVRYQTPWPPLGLEQLLGASDRGASTGDEGVLARVEAELGQVCGGPRQVVVRQGRGGRAAASGSTRSRRPYLWWEGGVGAWEGGVL